jgi:5-methylthioribose kinase
MTSHERPLDTPQGGEYRILREADLRDYLAPYPAVAARLGGSPAAWSIGEVGDGNLNLVFIVKGASGGIAVKQALPYVRLVGESWPLPLSRAHYEHQALTVQGRLAPGLVPALLHHDPALALTAMELLEPHIIMRKGLIAGTRYPRFVDDITTFLARTLFFTSDLAVPAAGGLRSAQPASCPRDDGRRGQVSHHRVRYDDCTRVARLAAGLRRLRVEG